MRHAFSLVELSIVLVILGLLTGGILAGKSLIRAAELRSVNSDFQRYQSTVAAFRDKFFYLPGDMPNAVRFWGAQAGALTDGNADTTCRILDYNSAATGMATCNGDGNGQIARYFNMTNSLMYESYRAWQHLANAGLVEGQYAGVADVAARTVTPGWNVPASKIGQAGYSLVYWGTDPDAGNSNTYIMPGDYGNVLLFGKPSNASTYVTYHTQAYIGILRTEEAWNIDLKMDDGLPGTGKLRTAGTSGNPSCASSNNPATAIYQLSNTGLHCGLILKLGL